MSVRYLFFILVLIGVVLYLPTLRNGFVWDDEEQIVNNPFVKSWQFVPQIFSGSTFGGGGTTLPTGGYYKPLMSVWFMVNYYLWGDWAGGYHLLQSVLHGLNAGLVFLIFLKLLGFFPSHFSPIHSRNLRWLAWGATLVWLVHPVQVESVSYAASAQELLYLFFGLVGMLLVMYRKRWRWQDTTTLMMSSCFMFLSLLSKESGAVMIVLTLVYLLAIEGKLRLAGMYGLLMTWVVGFYALLRFGVAGVGVERNPIIPVAQLNASERLLTIVETLFQHIRVMFWPLQLYIGHHQVVTEVNWLWWGKLMLVGGLWIGSLMWVWWKKSRVGLFFWLWVTISVGLVSNIVALDMTFAERWAYGPLVGVIGLLAVILKRITQNVKLKTTSYNSKLIMAVFAIITALLIVRNVRRQLDWKDGLTLYSHDLDFAQNAFDLENNLGVEVFRIGQVEEAKLHFERSIELNPEWWTAYSNLGVYFQRKGDKERAIELYRTSIEKGDYFLAYENLGALYLNQKDPKTGDFLEEAVGKLPNNARLREMWMYYNAQSENQ